MLQPTQEKTRALKEAYAALVAGNVQTLVPHAWAFSTGAHGVAIPVSELRRQLQRTGKVIFPDIPRGLRGGTRSKLTRDIAHLLCCALNIVGRDGKPLRRVQQKEMPGSGQLVVSLCYYIAENNAMDADYLQGLMRRDEVRPPVVLMGAILRVAVVYGKTKSS